MSVDGELPWRKKAVGKRALAGGVSVGLSSWLMPQVKEVKAEVVASSDGDGRFGRWPTTVDSVSAMLGVEAGAARRRNGGVKMEEASLVVPTREIRSTMAHGQWRPAAADGDGIDSVSVVTGA
jgi:hypothetical protein